MFIKKLGTFLVCLVLAACAGQNYNDWDEFEAIEQGQPTSMPEDLVMGGLDDYGLPFSLESVTTYVDIPCEGDVVCAEYDMPGFMDLLPDSGPPIHTVAVLLPLSGPDAALGRQIKYAIEIAFFQRQPWNILVSFHDISGPRENRHQTIERVISRKPNIIIGPIFAEDSKLVRELKPTELPVLSFTSDPSALGNGVLSVGLMPNQSVETIIKQIAGDGRRSVLFLAPDNVSGYINAGAAIESAMAYRMDISGLYYYAAGDTDSLKATAQRATLFPARSAMNDKARETLSNILIRERLCDADKISLTEQLTTLNKRDTLGNVPYDTVLFLGTAPDSKTLASFLRYYDLDQRSVKFYGTALWDSKILFSDITLSGSLYSSLPAIVSDFSRIYRDIRGIDPERISSMGYDAAMLAMNALQSKKDLPTFLLNPSGFTGLDGLIRLRANGTNERALEVMELTGGGFPRLRNPAPKNFLNPIFITRFPYTTKPAELELSTDIDPSDYVYIPAELRDKYRLAPYGRRSAPVAELPQIPTPMIVQKVDILPEDDSDIMNDPDFHPYFMEPVIRQNIDEVTVSE